MARDVSIGFEHHVTMKVKTGLWVHTVLDVAPPPHKGPFEHTQPEA